MKAILTTGSIGVESYLGWFGIACFIFILWMITLIILLKKNKKINELNNGRRINKKKRY